MSIRISRFKEINRHLLLCDQAEKSDQSQQTRFKFLSFLKPSSYTVKIALV